MLTVAYYFLQVCLCSAVMMGYYALVLRNKRFHQYNRFYLLGVAVLPWLVPLVKIEINKSLAAPTLPVLLFSVIANANSEFEHTVAANGFQLTWDVAAMLLYVTISSVFLLTLVVALVRIYRLLKHNPYKHLDKVYLVLTKANGTPFSFFKFIFWNAEIDVTTHTGKQMLQHELTHVQQRHSADKLLMQIVLIIGWFNPIFWLLKRELETIHEFIADNNTIQNGDTATLATMLLAAAYPQQKFALTNPFFYSPIKRRIAMLTNTKNLKFSYARRVVVLPLLIVITLLFAFRKKEDTPVIVSIASVMEKMANAVTDLAEVTVNSNKNPTNFASIILNKTYSVVIDAGHGGTDAGALGIDGKSLEKDIVLSIAKLIKENNRNANINIVLTRDDDVAMTPQQRVDYANKIGADLFVSVHCNSADGIRKNGGFIENPSRGYEVVLPSNDRVGMEDCRLLASSINTVLSGHSFSVGKVTQKQIGIWVLKATNCPATLVECGYISNTEDLKQLKTKTYQQEMANHILTGIETYLANNESDRKAVVVDTVPKVTVFKGDGNSEVIVTGTGKKKDGINKIDTTIYHIKPRNVDSVLFVIDGKKLPLGDKYLDKINPSNIKSMNVLKDKSAIEKYGEEAKNGVIEIFLKKVVIDTIVEIKKGSLYNIKTSNSLEFLVNTKKTGTKKDGTNKIDTTVYHIKPRNIDSVLFVIDGKKLPLGDKYLDKINPLNIKSMNVLKDKSAIEKYGEEAKNGVIEIFLKKDVKTQF